jgi:hypothetical protein
MRRFLYLPVFVAARQHVFWPNRLFERSALPGPMLAYIDALFYLNKLRANDGQDRSQNFLRSAQQKTKTRTAFKSVNGVSLATHIFADMYPDATFIALVRNGLALCEGFVRRGWTPERIGSMYEIVCQKILRDAACLDNYHIIYFEDLLTNPAHTMKRIYGYAGLDIGSTARFKLQAKRSMNEAGQRQYTFGSQDKETQWYTLDELKSYLRKDVNDNQIARLNERDKGRFLQKAHNSMSLLGYL